jgi:tRNA A-37 threonylcarbamoyl transferase component Bud32
MALFFVIKRLHRAGLAHNDFAERNVVIAYGRPRLIDFGLANMHNCLGQGRCGELWDVAVDLRVRALFHLHLARTCWRP